MAKQSSFTSLTGANVAAGDTFPVLDISDTTMAATGTNKQISSTELREAILSIPVTGLAHGNTDWVPTDVAARYGHQGTVGGAYTIGASDSGVGSVPYTLAGVFGSTDPTDTVPAIKMQGLKKSGGTGGQVLSALETVFQLQNLTTPVLTVLGSGNVGIGITNPGQKLDVNETIRTAGTLQFYNTGGSSYVAGSMDASQYQFYVSGSEKMRIDTSGNVGIGTTSPSAKLSLNGGLHVGGDSDPGDNNALVDGTLAVVGTARLSSGYTVATLPTAGTAGRRAYVTDATAPTFLGALTGGGAVVCPVFDNGTAWVSA